MELQKNLYSNIYNFSDFNYKEEGNQKQYILYAPLFEAGIVGGYTIEGIENQSVYYSQSIVDKMCQEAKNRPVDIEHNNQSIGTCIDTFRNTEGFKTESGLFVPQDGLWYCKLSVNLDDNININDYGLSIENNVKYKKLTSNEVNNAPCDYEAESTEPLFISIVKRDTSRLTQCRRLYNSANKNEEKLDNNNLTGSLEENNMTPEQFEEIKNLFSSKIEELKGLLSVKNSEPTTPATPMQNNDIEKEDKKNENPLANSEGNEGVLKEILSKLNELLNKEKAEDLQNSEESEEEKREKLQNSITGGNNKSSKMSMEEVSELLGF